MGRGEEGRVVSHQEATAVKLPGIEWLKLIGLIIVHTAIVVAGVVWFAAGVKSDIRDTTTRVGHLEAATNQIGASMSEMARAVGKLEGGRK